MPDRPDVEMKAVVKRCCITCGRPLEIYRWRKDQDEYGYKGTGMFCTARCGVKYGLEAATGEH